MEDIVRRIKKAGEITSTADWQINRLVMLGQPSEVIEWQIQQSLNASYPTMFELHDKIVEYEYVRNKDVYEQINARYISLEDNSVLRRTVMTGITQLGGYMADYHAKKLGTDYYEVGWHA